MTVVKKISFTFAGALVGAALFVPSASANPAYVFSGENRPLNLGGGPAMSIEDTTGVVNWTTADNGWDPAHAAYDTTTGLIYVAERVKGQGQIAGGRIAIYNTSHVLQGTITANVNFPVGVTTDGTRVYWTNAFCTNSSTCDDTMGYANKASPWGGTGVVNLDSGSTAKCNQPIGVQAKPDNTEVWVACLLNTKKVNVSTLAVTDNGQNTSNFITEIDFSKNYAIAPYQSYAVGGQQVAGGIVVYNWSGGLINNTVTLDNGIHLCSKKGSHISCSDTRGISCGKSPTDDDCLVAVADDDGTTDANFQVIHPTGTLHHTSGQNQLGYRLIYQNDGCQQPYGLWRDGTQVVVACMGDNTATTGKVGRYSIVVGSGNPAFESITAFNQAKNVAHYH